MKEQLISLLLFILILTILIYQSKHLIIQQLNPQCIIGEANGGINIIDCVTCIQIPPNSRRLQLFQIVSSVQKDTPKLKLTNQKSNLNNNWTSQVHLAQSQIINQVKQQIWFAIYTQNQCIEYTCSELSSASGFEPGSLEKSGFILKAKSTQIITQKNWKFQLPLKPVAKSLPLFQLLIQQLFVSYERSLQHTVILKFRYSISKVNPSETKQESNYQPNVFLAIKSESKIIWQLMTCISTAIVVGLKIFQERKHQNIKQNIGFVIGIGFGWIYPRFFCVLPLLIHAWSSPLHFIPLCMYILSLVTTPWLMSMSVLVTILTQYQLNPLQSSPGSQQSSLKYGLCLWLLISVSIYFKIEEISELGYIILYGLQVLNNFGPDQKYQQIVRNGSVQLTEDMTDL